MKKSIICIAAIVALLAMAFGASAQVTAVAKQGTGITVDGHLNEGVWANAEKLPLKHDEGMQLTDGIVDDHNDCSGEFSLVWDDEGFYCASWTKDDVHNSPWTVQPGMAHNAWMDDGHEWWISFDFNDVWEDASPSYHGQYGWQVMKGWVWENGAPSDLYVAHYDQNASATNSTVADLKEQGFYAPYTSTDGLSFTTEAQFKWSSFMLGSISTPSAGKELGFNLGICDNDGGTMAEGWLRWAEGCHNNYQGWGKVTLSADQVKIRPVRSVRVGIPSLAKTNVVFDVFGRRVHATGNALSGSAIRFHYNGTETKRAIILR